MRAGLAFIAIACLASGCGSADAETGDEANLKKLKGVTEAERAAYLAKAEVWVEAKMPSRTPDEILAGPPGDDTFGLNEEVSCDFVEPNKDDKLGGMTPKFQCKLPSGEIIKVKYSRGGNNDEVYSEIMATRVMWSIGLPADRMYPVRVTCNDCPEEPWAAYVQAYGTLFNKLRFRSPGPRATRRFEVAAIERKFEAVKIEGPDGTEGWGWDELPARPDAYWGMNAAARADFDQAHPEQVRFDALRLYAAWIKQADNKAENQRLVCMKKGVTSEGKCNKPLIMMQDLGVSFGGGTELGGLKYEKVSKASLPGWTNQSKSPTWKDFSKCQASLTGSLWSGTLNNPRVSNAGRAMIAERLAALDEDQLRAIFQATRIEEKQETWTDPDTGEERLVTVDDWIRMFQWMVGLIDDPCPEH